MLQIYAGACRCPGSERFRWPSRVSQTREADGEADVSEQSKRWRLIDWFVGGSIICDLYVCARVNHDGACRAVCMAEGGN